MIEHKEPDITVNGIALTQAQAMTVRVALQTFAATLREDSLGEDDVGRGITQGYLAAVRAINSLIMRKQ